jgi:hypothetical protein
MITPQYSTCNIFWSCYYPPQNSHLVLLRPPYLFLVLLQSSVFGLITTPYFWSYYATPHIGIFAEKLMTFVCFRQFIDRRPNLANPKFVCRACVRARARV